MGLLSKATKLRGDEPEEPSKAPEVVKVVKKGYLVGEFLEGRNDELVEIKRATIMDEGTVFLEVWYVPYGNGEGYAKTELRLTKTEFDKVKAGKAVRSWKITEKRAEGVVEKAPVQKVEKTPEKKDPVAELKSDLWWYEGKKGMVDLKKIASNLGMEFKSNIGKSALIKQITSEHDVKSVRKAMKGEVVVEVEEVVEEETKIKIPKTDEEARRLIPSLFYTKTDMIAAGNAYGLDIPTDASLKDATSLIVEKGRDVWIDFVKVDRLDGDMVTPAFYIQSFLKGAIDDRGNIIEVEEISAEYNAMAKKGVKYRHWLMDSEGNYRWAMYSEPQIIGKHQYLIYHFGNALTPKETKEFVGEDVVTEGEEALESPEKEVVPSVEPAEEPKKGVKRAPKKEGEEPTVKEIGLSFISDYKIFIDSAKSDKDRKNRNSKIEAKLTKLYPERGSKAYRWLLNNETKFSTELTDSVKERIDVTECDNLSSLENLMINTDSNDVREYVGKRVGELLEDINCQMESEQAGEEVQEELVDEILEDMGETVPFTYEDIITKSGRFAGQPNFVQYKSRLSKLGVKLQKDDPLWIALKERGDIPSDLIMQRMKPEPEVEKPVEVVEEKKRPKREPVPSKEDIKKKEYQAMRDMLKGLTNDEIDIMVQSRGTMPDWKRTAIEDEMADRRIAVEGIPPELVSETAEKVMNEEINVKDLNEDMASAVAEYMRNQIEMLEGKKEAVPIPEQVKTEVKESYSYDDILVNGVPNWMKFLSVIKAMDFDVSDMERNKRWFASSQWTKRIPVKGDEVFKETWQEFQKRTASAYQEVLPTGDKDRREKVSYLWKEYGRKGVAVPIDEFEKEPVMSHSEWMKLYLARPYKLGFKKVNELWHDYGVHGKFPPKKALPVDPTIAEWTTKDTRAEDTQAVLDWIDENRQPIRYEQLIDIFRDREKALNVLRDMKEVTWEGQEERFRKYFDSLAQYEEGRNKLRYMALTMGKDFSNPTVMNRILSEHFGDEGTRAYIPEQHLEIAKDAFPSVVVSMFKDKESVDEFNRLWSSGKKNDRVFDLIDDMSTVSIDKVTLDNVSEDQIKLYEDYVSNVGGRDVRDYEFFASHPELSRKEARAIVARALLGKSAMEYGEMGRKPLTDKQVEGILNRITDTISGYKYGENKNRLSKQVSDYILFNREWARRKGTPFSETLVLDEIGEVPIATAERFSMGGFTEDMIPEGHVELVHDYIRDNLRIPGKEALLEMIADPAEVEFILNNVVYTDIENIMSGSRPYAFTDEEVSRMAKRKGLSGSVLRTAMKAWKDHNQLPMTALESAKSEFEKQQREIALKFERIDASSDAREYLRDIFKVSPDRATAVRKIGEYVENLHAQIKAKEGDRARLINSWSDKVDGEKVTFVGLAELESKKRKTKQTKSRIEEIKTGIDDVDADVLQLQADIDLAMADMKYRVYKDIKDDYLIGQARFSRRVGDEDEEFSNFNKMRVEVARGIDGFARSTGSDYVHVNLEDIYHHWIAPIELGLDDVVRDRAKGIKDPRYKELYDAYVYDAKRSDELSERMDELMKDLSAEDVTEETINRVGGEIEDLRETINRIERSQRNRQERLTNYKDQEKVEPSIGEVVQDREKSGKWSPGWKKQVATIALMNKARELGLYDYMYQMAKISRELTPPLKDMPLTIYPSDSESIREALFGEWLEQALTFEDISKWEPRTLVDFVGDDWNECGDIFSRIDTRDWDSPARRREKAGQRKDKWQDCAIRKAKVIQSQSIAQADPLVLQPIIETVVKEEVAPSKMASLIEQREDLKKTLSESLSLSEALDKKVTELEDGKVECEAELVTLRDQLHKKGVVTAVVRDRGKRTKKVEAITEPQTEEQKKLMKEILGLQDKISSMEGDVEDAIDIACENDPDCVSETLSKIADVEKDVKKRARKRPASIAPRDFCFTPPEWDTFKLALSERKLANTKQFKRNTRLMDKALDQGITRDVPLYKHITGALQQEKDAIESLETFIKKYEDADFVCSADELKNVRKFSDKEIEDALEI